MRRVNILLSAATMAGAVTPLATAIAQQAKTKPNVIIIYADDVGFGDLSCNGTSAIKTPNVERLAASGIRFTNAHTTSATSTPSRYGLLTGQYPWRKEGTGIAAGNAGMIIRPEQYTMADMFKSAGYTTAAIGKWHLGLGDKTGEQDWNGVITPSLHDIGFDYFYIMAATADRVPCVYIENQRIVDLDPSDPVQVSYKEPFAGEPTGKNNPEMLKLTPSHGHDQAIVNGISRIGYMKGGKKALWRDEDIADRLAEKAVAYIESQREHPFFLYLGTNDIHVPRAPHERFVGKSGMGARGDAILSFDYTVGLVLEAVDRLGIADNTIIILSSDNGPVVDDGYNDRAQELMGSHLPAGIYRGGKYSAFEAGTRVPMIVSWSNHTPMAVTDALVSHIDLFASLASLTGVKIPQGAAPDSRNSMATLLGHNGVGREYMVAQSVHSTLSIVCDNWKYIEPSSRPALNRDTNTELGNTPKPQLYDLSTDPGERRNVAEKHPTKVAEMKAKLDRIKSEK